MKTNRAIDPVASTSCWMAAARARESERPDRLFDDPLAGRLAGEAGFAWLRRLEPPVTGPGLYSVIRTHYFDRFLLDVCRHTPVRQVVLAAAGMDTRAFRLEWPPGIRIYEMDLPEVLEAKAEVIDSAGAAARCERSPIGTDLRHAAWADALIAAGYRPDAPSVWLMEGLLFYLSRAAVRDLLERVGDLTAPDSRLGLDVASPELLLSPATWPLQAALAWHGAPPRFGTSAPRTLLKHYGWDATAVQPGEEGARFGRWPRPLVPSWMPGVPRLFLVRARRSAAFA